MTIIISIVLLLLSLYGMVCGYMYYYQEKMIFQGTREIKQTPTDFGLDYIDLTLTTSDKVKINAWYVPIANSKLTVLFFHGNTGNMGDTAVTFKMFHQIGISCLMIDYRGYGNSSGEPSESGSYLDGDAAWHYLLDEIQLKPEQVVLVGRSLGGGVATELATRYECRALVLESTFTTMPAIAKDVHPFMPAFWLIKHEYNNLLKIHDIKCPVLIIHSKEDKYIDISHARKLYRSLKRTSKKKFIEMTGNHGEGYIQSGEIYTDALRDFIQTL